jgi:hypothetical protein
MGDIPFLFQNAKNRKWVFCENITAETENTKTKTGKIGKKISTNSINYGVYRIP